MERNLYDKAEDILGIKLYAINESLLDSHEQLMLMGKEKIGLIEEQGN